MFLYGLTLTVVMVLTVLRIHFHLSTDFSKYLYQLLRQQHIKKKMN